MHLFIVDGHHKTSPEGLNTILQKVNQYVWDDLGMTVNVIATEEIQPYVPYYRDKDRQLDTLHSWERYLWENDHHSRNVIYYFLMPPLILGEDSERS